MGSIPVIKIKNNYHLVWGHHRVQALKEIYGKDYEIDCELKKYNDEQLLKGMIIENLTQRVGEFREETANCVAVQTFLNKHLERLITLRDSRRVKGSYQKKAYQGKATAEDIARWIDPNNEIISHDKVTNLLNIYDNLDESLQKEVEKTHKGSIDRRGEVLSFTQAERLSHFEDKQEQKDLAKALKSRFPPSCGVKSSTTF